ncbi:MAG: ABC transporter permease, partial [Lachnospiraceae bacterium]|nr:ABC transporter permease [Lachnospiraceae bacterium]
MRNPLKPMVDKFGLPRVIIVSFFLLLVVAAGAFRMNLLQLLS